MSTYTPPTPAATKTFTAPLFQVHSYGPNNSLGQMHHEMNLYRAHPSCGDCIIWNFGRQAADEDEEVIGLIFEGQKVIDFDGVFELPTEAAQLLTSAGYDLSELGLDAEGNELPLSH